MKFKGMVISDYDASGELMHHKVAKDLNEVAEKCLDAGLDMEMVTKSFVYHLKETDENTLYVNEAVKKILTLKYKLGLFDDPYKGLGYKDKYLLEAYREKAREVAEASVVLLENKGILPLNKDLKIGLIGPHGDNHEVNGFWSAIGSNEDTVTLKEGLEASGFDVICEKACEINGERYVSQEALVEKFKDVDVIILAIGEHQDMSGEGASRSEITVPEGQVSLYHQVKTLKKPIVTIIFSGRPLLLKPFKESDALIQGWFLGTESGHALSNILKGAVSPKGRLIMTFPESLGQVPIYYNHLPTGRSLSRGEIHRRFSSRYIDVSNHPLYPFGYGLTYGNFKYENFKISQNHITLDNEVFLSFEITNTSQHQATELVQLYIEATYGQISRPCRELRDYKHVELKPNESKKVEFKVYYKTLAYRNHLNELVADPGQYHIYISKHAEEHIYKETLKLEVSK
ncbi:MAG: glycoside hydrolase family 3 C-terminal domain-containing protein [Clostridia bacterium]|nr:glycoside hydrolase family 3 C-terminal domain-containing protein [Clostridia bacterium]